MRSNHPFVRPLAALASVIGSLVIPCCTPVLAQNLYTNPEAAVSPQRGAGAPRAIPALPLAQTPGAGGAHGQTGGGAQTQQPVGSPTPTEVAPANGGGAPAVVSPQATVSYGGSVNDALNGVSMFVVTVPPPKRYQKNDRVMVIVNESDVQNFTQTTDLKKDYTNNAELSNFPSLEAFFTQLALREGINGTHPKLGVTSKNELKGDGKLDRKDQVTAKVSATVLDVKPNGDLVLEAQKSMRMDKETQTMVLSGTCRAEDITKNNTIQSYQMASLNIKIEHEGDVKETGKKGWIPRVLEAVFGF